MPFDETLAFRVRQCLLGEKDLTEKKMFGGVAWMAGGRMACGIIEDRLMIRLHPEVAEKSLKKPHVGPMDFKGRPMPGFIWLEPPGIETPRQLKTWVDKALVYARAQGPKTDVKKKKKPAPKTRVRKSKGLTKKPAVKKKVSGRRQRPSPLKF